MTTKHFYNWQDFEQFGRKQPYGTQFFVRKVSPEGLDVLISSPGEKMPAVEEAEAFADLAMADPSMKCVATGVTEFGTTGTCVPRMPHEDHVCWWCNKPGATIHITDPLEPGKDWMHTDCYWSLQSVIE